MKYFKIIILFIISAFIFLGFIEYNNSYQNDLNVFYTIQKECINSSSDVLCDLVLKSEAPIKLDAFTLTIYIFTQTVTRYLVLLIPLFLIFIGIEKLNKKNLKKELLTIWKYSLLIPILLIFSFLMSILVSNNFDYQNTIGSNIAIIPNEYYSVSFIITYLLVFILRSVYWINLGLISYKLCKNKIAAIIVAYLLFIILALIGDLIPGNYLAFGYIWRYEYISSLLLMMLANASIAIISTLIILQQYKENNKKKKLKSL